MDKKLILEQTKNHIKELTSNDCTGHDWWHIYRVWKMACYIAKKENANIFIVELAALLHDIDDWKFKNNALLGANRARQWLESICVEEKIITTTCQIIESIGFKGNGADKPVLNAIEAKIVQDADRLDAIGAIGIARTFAYGGHKGRPLHNPEISHTIHQNFEAYRKNQSTTFNHFYEKLLLLKDLMYTETAKCIAKERHQFMENFIKHFLDEWDVLPADFAAG